MERFPLPTTELRVLRSIARRRRRIARAATTAARRARQGGRRRPRRQSQNSLRRVLSSNHNGRRRVPRQLAGENGRVHHENIVRANDLGIRVHHRRTVVLDAHLGRAHPVVRPPRAGGQHEGLDIVPRGLIGGGLDPLEPFNVGQGGLHVFDALDEGFFVAAGFVVEEGRGGDYHV